MECAKNNQYNRTSNPTRRAFAVKADYVMRAIPKEKREYKEELAFKESENQEARQGISKP